MRAQTLARLAASNPFRLHQQPYARASLLLTAAPVLQLPLSSVTVTDRSLPPPAAAASYWLASTGHAGS